MDLNSIIYALGATGFFTSRAFLPAFLTACTLRFGDSLPYLKELEFLQATGAEPTWFTSNIAIGVMGLLALIEVGATKIPEAQEALEGVHKYAKTAMGALSTIGVLTAGDVSFIEDTISQAGIVDVVLGSIVAAAVWVTATARNGLMELLSEADSEDDLGIRRLISWGEDIWSSFGVLAIFLYPIFMTVLLLIFIGGIFGIQKYLAYRDEKSKVPCSSCQTPMYASALACPNCKAENTQPMAVGFLGGATRKPAPDRDIHRFRLVTKKRCPVCASRFEKREPQPDCPSCGHQLFADAESVRTYISNVNKRLPKALIVSGLFSLIPVFGLIPGVIYYRVQLLAPFRAYIPATRNLLLKWGIRLLFFCLIWFQVVPGLGAFVVPFMALVSYLAYRSAFTSLMQEKA